MDKTILIIEDNVELLKLLHDRLASEGFKVLDAPDGQKGLALALARHPDLIILDIMLPDIDGIEVLKKLHADPWGRHVEVVMLTNLSDSKRVSGALALGSHYFLVKSDWKIEDVVNVAEERLNLKK